MWIILGVVLVFVFYLAFRHHDETQAADKKGGGKKGFGGPVTLNTVTAKQGDIGVYLTAIGTVTPVYTSVITSQVNGIINSVHYKEAQVVHKGDPLIDVDPRTYQAQLLQAEGTLEKDTHILEQSRMDLERYQKAWSRNAIAKQILDDQEKLALQNEGTVKNDQGVVDFDRVQLGYCHIVAPFDGRVGLRLVDPGNVVQSNSTTPLVVVTQMQPITVVFTVAEDYLGEIQPHIQQGTPLNVDVFDRAQLKKITSGKLLAVDNQIDTTTGTVRLRAQFDNRKNELFPNQFVNTRLLVNTQHNVTLIPTSAIQHNGNLAFVYVIENNTAHLQNIKPGVEDNGMTAVQGINPNDVVANSSFERLQDKAQVKISNTPQPASATPETNAP
ncbi:MAG TPA: efflux RND transporter periplasmic adaptor subunit [Candidatus Acidoferrum sp.]|nr:efflux RND transporter periplasmic adaptor subunit [Candidatus Acidoferrum sp.]